MSENLKGNNKQNVLKILEWAKDQLMKGEFRVVLAGEKLDFAVNLLTELKERGKRRMESPLRVPGETFSEFIITDDIDRQNISMFTMLKEADFGKEAIREYFDKLLIDKYAGQLRWSVEKIAVMKASVTKALDEVFPTLN